jgi:integrase
MAEVLFATGLRFSEVTPLKGSDVTDAGPGRKAIRISRTLAEVGGKLVIRDYGKTPGAMRSVPISDELADRLTAQARRDLDGYLFRGKNGAFIKRAVFWRIWRAAAKTAGVPGLTVHGARHSVASWLANTPELPIVLVRDMLGHSSIAITNTYVHAMDDGGDDPRLAALARIAS